MTVKGRSTGTLEEEKDILKEISPGISLEGQTMMDIIKTWNKKLLPSQPSSQNAGHTRTKEKATECFSACLLKNKQQKIDTRIFYIYGGNMNKEKTTLPDMQSPPWSLHLWAHLSQDLGQSLE